MNVNIRWVRVSGLLAVAGLMGAGASAGVGGAARRASEGVSGKAGQVAIVQGVKVSAEELAAGLMEAAGGVVLQERVIDTMLAARLAGRPITPAMIEAERAELLREVGAAADQQGGGGDEALRTITRVREARGLGPKRFEALLARNAGLRALVSEGVVIGEPEVAAGFMVAHGPKAVVRLASFSTLGDSKAFRDEVVKAAGDGRPSGGLEVQGDGATVGEEATTVQANAVRSLAFAVAAVAKSTDASATIGGKIEPLSTVDERYPRAIRTAIDGLGVGMLSDVLALDRGFAVVLIEEKRAASGAVIEGVRGDIERQLRRRQERLAMDKLARSMLAEAQVMVTDSSLAWSWGTIK